MAKVELFAGNPADVVNAVNEFIKDKKVIDIKYQAVFCQTKVQNIINDRVLVVYEEKGGDSVAGK